MPVGRESDPCLKPPHGRVWPVYQPRPIRVHSTPLHRVVIVGGGFGGLNAAKELGSMSQVEVTLIDRRTITCFQPCCTRSRRPGLSPAEIARSDPQHPLEACQHRVLQGEVTAIHLERNRVINRLRHLRLRFPDPRLRRPTRVFSATTSGRSSPRASRTSSKRRRFVGHPPGVRGSRTLPATSI